MRILAKITISLLLFSSLAFAQKPLFHANNATSGPAANVFLGYGCSNTASVASCTIGGTSAGPGFANLVPYQPVTTGSNTNGYKPINCLVYFSAHGAPTANIFQCAIYTSDGGSPAKPNTKVCNMTTDQSISSTGWISASMPGSGCDLAANTVYFFAFNTQDASAVYKYDASPTGAKDQALAYGNWNDPAGTVSSDFGSVSIAMELQPK